MQKEKALVHRPNISLALRCSQLVQYKSTAEQETYLHLHRGKGGTSKKEPHMFPCACTFCLSQYFGWLTPRAGLLRKDHIKFSLSCTKGIQLLRDPCPIRQLVIPRGTAIMMILLLIGFPSSISYFRLHLQGKASLGFSRLVKCSKSSS